MTLNFAEWAHVFMWATVCLFVCWNYSLTLVFEYKCEHVLSAYLFLWAFESVCLHAIMIKPIMRCVWCAVRPNFRPLLINACEWHRHNSPLKFALSPGWANCLAQIYGCNFWNRFMAILGRGGRDSDITDFITLANIIRHLALFVPPFLSLSLLSSKLGLCSIR